MPRPVVVAVVLLLAVGCTADSAPDPDARQSPSSPTASASAPPSPAPPPEPDQELVVVSHATVAQLDLTTRAAARLVAGELTRWRGFRVVLGDGPDRAEAAVRAVERDPLTLAVVPLELVGPTVVAARVDGVDPVRDRPDATALTVVGDLMLVRGVPDPAAALAPLSARLRRADLTVGNLESTLSRNGVPSAIQGNDAFGGTSALLGPLRRAGFDALSLANNHSGDYGETALLETVRALANSPIAPFGAGRDLREAERPAVLDGPDGTRFAFIGFNAIGETARAEERSPGAFSVRMPPRTGPLVDADLERVLGSIRAAERTADVVVVLPHWGTQYTHVPHPIQRVVARRLVEAGADLVAGGHPHWVQGVDAIAGVPVVHSLGNFVFDMDFYEETMEGVVLEATFWGAELKAIRLVPYRMDADTFAPRPVSDRTVLADVWGASTGPYAG